MHILIVDDVPDDLSLLRDQLEAEGHTAVGAGDGIEALAALEAGGFDAVISDILMPRMDGHRLCYEIRRSERFKDLPFIAYTAVYLSPADEELCLELGADRYLRKPAPGEEIAAALEEVCGAERRTSTRILEDADSLREYREWLISRLEAENIGLVEMLELTSLQATALATAASAVVITDGYGIIQWVNPAFTELTGYTPEEAIGNSPRILRSGVHDATFYKKFWKTIKAGKVWRGEFTNRRKDGRLYYDEHTITPVVGPDGAITHFVAIMHDLTDRKAADEALRQSEERSRSLVSSANDAIISADGEGTIIAWNKGANAIFGYTEEEALGQPLQILIPEGLRDAHQAGLARFQATGEGTILGQVVTLTALRKGGEEFPVEFTLSSWGSGDSVHFSAIIRDITDRRRAEQALQESEERLRQVFEYATQGFYTHAPNGKLTYVSPGMADLLDCTLEEALQPWTNFLTDHPINAEGIEHTRRAIETGEPQPPYSLELRSQRGRILWVEVRESPVVEDGKTVAIVGALTDITERVATEASRQSKEARLLKQRDALAEFIEGTTDAEDLEGTIRRLLETAAKTLGVARVSVWRYTSGRSAIRCEDLYELEADRHSSGLELPAASYPAYFLALEKGEVIAAEHAQEDARTAEFAEGYLQPLGITSMLDAPIHVAGIGQGVLCHEHVGAPRGWTSDEQTFAIAVANRVTLAFEAAERRQAERELAASVRFAQNTIDALSAHLCVLDETGNIVATNKAWREFADSNSSTCRQYVSGNYLDVCDHATGDEAVYAADFAAGIRAVLRGERENFELEYSCHSPDTLRWFVGRVTRFSGEGAVFAVVAHENITATKLAQEAQLESAEKLRLSIEAANVGLWDWDLRTNQVMFSAEWKRQLGYNEDEIADDFAEWESRVHPDDLAQTLAHIQRSLTSRGPAHEVEFRMRHKDGGWRWIYARAEITFELDGTAIRMQGCHLDITRRKRAEAETQLLAQRLSLATGAASVGVWDWNIEADEWFATDTYFTMLGYAPEEGFSDREVWLERAHPDDREATRRRIQAVLAGGREPYEYEARIRHADGDYRWVRVIGRPLELDADGKPRRMIGVRIDITDSRRTEEALRESELRLRQMAENIHEVFWMTDVARSEMLYIGPAYEEIWGRTCESLLTSQTNWSDTIHPEDRERVLAAQARQGEGTYDEEYRIVRPDGEVRWIRDQAFPVRDEHGEVIRITGVAHDITLQRAAEDQLVLLNSELEERIVERTRALAQATADAERANMAKSEFLSRMSHELRTPMNSVLGYAQLLEMELTDARYANYVGRILKGGRHLLDLINEVLELSRIEAQRIDLSIEPIFVSDVIRECLQLVQPLANTGGVVLHDHTLGSALYVQADQQRLRQILMNLLANAIKYNRPGGSVIASVWPEGATARIDVADSGIGIPPGTEGKLFTPFERLGASERAIEGTGLGLSLSLQMAVAMGGSLEYRPGPDGVGSIFSLTLPISESVSTSEDHVAPESEQTLAFGGTVLYIEDNLSNVEFVQEVLSRYPSVQLLVAMQGRMGLALAEEHRPDLILLDLHLPDMEGSEVLSAIRSNPALQAMPVIILSADATERQVRRLMDLGASAYMTKPFKLAELIGVLSDVFANVENAGSSAQL